MTGTDQKNSTPVTREDSRAVRYELIDKNGNVVRQFDSAHHAVQFAIQFFPDQEQDEDRTGKGWDIQVEGCE